MSDGDMEPHKGHGGGPRGPIPSGARVETYFTEAGGYAWRRFASNGEEISRSSEAYENRDHARTQAAEEAALYGVPVFYLDE